ncbi:hypothetical protein ABZ951_23365 [Streptomyces sp. NPDC046215]|uniref:hypothetical protein n=1 Tax=Streptomyces TaxID=1883 RepID=UPI0031CE606D
MATALAAELDAGLVQELASVLREAGAQYIGAVMFAVTAAAVGALRAAWRRRGRGRRGEDAPLAGDE